jgi:hypothetical protein
VPARTCEINVERALWEILHPSRRRQPSLSRSQLIQGTPVRLKAKISYTKRNVEKEIGHWRHGRILCLNDRIIKRKYGQYSVLAVKKNNF